MKCRFTFKNYILIFSLFVFSLFEGCHSILAVEGSGNPVTINRKIENFTALDVSGGVSILISSTQPDTLLTLICDDNLTKFINIYNEGSDLVIFPVGNIWSKTPIKIILPYTQLSNLDFSGAIKFSADNNLFFDSKTFSIETSGSCNITLPLKTNITDLDISGACDIVLTGSTNILHVEASGANKVFADELEAGVVSLDASGANEFKINVKEELELDLAGANKVSYKGNPTKIKQDVSGASKIIKVE